tara:strand:+ start:6390 stop:7295 length:906 start_codon:yes stop_codon:yes gene_type:complete
MLAPQPQNPSLARCWSVLCICGAITILPLSAETITVKGSDTLVVLAQKWAKSYMTEHPKIRIQVTGGGSGTGLAALQNNTTDLANASRRIKPSETIGCIKAFKHRPLEFKICLDGLSIFVNESNPVSEISLAQLKAVFTGSISNWKALGGADSTIMIYGRENSSGTYDFFKSRVLKGADYSFRIQSMPGTAALVQAVAKDRNGIGYGGSAFGQGVRRLRVRRRADGPAYAPTEDNVRSQKYPIWRYLYVYLNPAQNKGVLADYLNWMQSQVGQQVAADSGYYPLPGSETRQVCLTRNKIQE